MIADHKGEVPFLVYLLPFMAGIGLALWFNPAVFITWFYTALDVLALCFTILNIGFARFRVYKFNWLGGALMHLILLLAGMISVSRNDARNSANYFEKIKADTLQAIITNEPQFKNGYLRFIVEAKGCIKQGQLTVATGNLLITLPADSATAKRYAYGDAVIFPAKYSAVDPPFNPGEFNYKQYLARQNIYAQAFLISNQLVVVAHHLGNPVMAYALQMRQTLIKCFKENMHSAEAIAVASTLILGYKADLSDDVLQAYTKTGTIHILSVSGGHVIILFALIGFVLGFMDRWRHGKILRVVFTVSLIWYYALLSGLSPAVCRAAVMISMVSIGQVYNRYISTLNILAASAFFLLLLNPLLIADVGFQLSYLAVAGLIIFQPIIYNWLDIDNKYMDWLWKFCAASIAAQAITFPLSAYYFHQFPVYFLISNLFILPLAEVIMYAGIGCLLFAQLSLTFVAKWLGWVLEHAILIMDKGLALIEHYPLASISKIWLTGIECVLLSILLIIIFAITHYKKLSLLKWALVCLLVLSISFNIKIVRAANTTGITFLNLKKHTGIVYRNGTTAIVVTDLADTSKTYRYAVQPGIDSCRITNTTYCALNHDMVNNIIIKKGNLMRFGGQDILLFTRQLQKQKPKDSISVNYLLFADNSRAGLKALDNHYRYQHLLVASSINNRNLTLMKIEADSMHKKLFSLRRNYSCFFKSN